MVPAALWSRLRALDSELRRENANTDNAYTSRVNFDRRWAVVIRDRCEPESVVTCYAVTLTQALKGAIEMAAQKG
jgi:hypothetical protein